MDIVDKEGCTPLDIARQEREEGVVQLLQDKAAAKKAAKDQRGKEAAMAEQVRAMQEELAALKAEKEAAPKAAPLDDCRIPPSCLKEGPELGRGGFGVVLHGELQLPGQRGSQKLAIKKLSLNNPTKMQHTEFTFEVIGTVHASRRCPHVLHCYGYSALRDGSLCLVMKYYERGTLQDLIIGQVYDPLPMKQVLQLALDIAMGVQELHAAQILIDDIKASNVLIDDDGTAVIADFGLSRPLVDQTHVSSTVVAGTMAYMAPEKHEDTGRVKFGLAADIWALGITLAQIVAADVAAPWRGQSALYIMKRLALEKKPPEVEATPELPGLQTLIQDCLHIEPRSRPTADMVVKRLQELATMCGGR
ncbi:kinase-like domain-containing protein [Dunaliella salina]|uniref:Kinase-like domain-containing protein n=1 Tax=Dunaliella salina TaxID=3046 RepID=A0ABQ7H4U3_DUNSA|nr:kinase-like domain-containing protein [Dunaliella salina]|eukprot:KAF5841883.1 kinase-like domain-containing protein [Dunaliella salina]